MDVYLWDCGHLWFVSDCLKIISSWCIPAECGFERISLEMLYRGLYHFGVARNKGIASDPGAYFAAPENQDLDVVKSLRKPLNKLDLRPFPDGGLTFYSSA